MTEITIKMDSKEYNKLCKVMDYMDMFGEDELGDILNIIQDSEEDIVKIEMRSSLGIGGYQSEFSIKTKSEAIKEIISNYETMILEKNKIISESQEIISTRQKEIKKIQKEIEHCRSFRLFRLIEDHCMKSYKE